MDLNIESPFSFELGDELFPLPSLSSCIDHIPSFPQLKSISPLDINFNSVSQKPKIGRRRKSPADVFNEISDESPHDQRKKKIIHRDVERQRRQEMSALYATLRSLLPVEYLKGKRSICDHMHEAIKYIGHMQTKIQQLSEIRDELQKQSDQNLIHTVETLSSSKRDSVVVRPNNGFGFQVVLDTAAQHRLPVSNILQVLVEEGLQILSCTSTKLNDRFLHTIQCQPALNPVSCSPTIIDAFQLQFKLTNLEYFPFD